MLRTSFLKSTSNTHFYNDSAYEVLSDESKRRNYDQTGTTDENQSFSQEDMFKNYLGQLAVDECHTAFDHVVKYTLVYAMFYLLACNQNRIIVIHRLIIVFA